MVILFTDKDIAGYAVHDVGDRLLVAIPGSGSDYGYIYKRHLHYITHSKLLSGHAIFTTHSAAFNRVDAWKYGIDPISLVNRNSRPMLDIYIQPDSYLWLYAEIYGNQGDPYYLNQLDEAGVHYGYTGPNQNELIPILERLSCVVSVQPQELSMHDGES